MATTQDSNGGLYFIVGGLVVAVLVFAAFYYNGSLGSIEPSAGPSVIERTNTIVEKAVPTPESRSTTTSVDLGGNGVSATTTTTNGQ